MKLAQDPEQTNRFDPAWLNEKEREALFLLAEGHTVKSIASLTGGSVAAIKTGVGSTRELARLLKAQENRDEAVRSRNQQRGIPIAVKAVA